MRKALIFHGKTIEIEYTKKAEEMAQQLAAPMVMEIQIYFSCMLGKNLAYYSGTPLPGAYQLKPAQFEELLKDSQQLMGNVYVRFNIVMTKNCPVAGTLGPPPVTDFEIVGTEVYVPTWLSIGYRDDVFIGEYGWKSSKPGQLNTRQIRDTALQKSDYL